MGGPVERPSGGSYDPGLRPRVARLEQAMSDVKASLDRLWGILATLLTAYACGLAALAILK